MKSQLVSSLFSPMAGHGRLITSPYHAQMQFFFHELSIHVLYFSVAQKTANLGSYSKFFGSQTYGLLVKTNSWEWKRYPSYYVTFLLFIISFVHFTNNPAILPVLTMLGFFQSIWTNLGIKIWWQLQNCGKMAGLLVKRTKNIKNSSKSGITTYPSIFNIQVDLGVIKDWKKLRKQIEKLQFCWQSGKFSL